MTTTVTSYGRCALESTTKIPVAGNTNRASIRGKVEGEADESDSCLTDEDSLSPLNPLKGEKDGEKNCDITPPPPPPPPLPQVRALNFSWYVL